jgi:hypothetical protein
MVLQTMVKMDRISACLGLALYSSACSTASAPKDSNLGAECGTNACTSRTWAQLVVAQTPSADGGLTVTPVDGGAAVTSAEGDLLPVHVSVAPSDLDASYEAILDEGPCPETSSSVVCEYAFQLGPTQRPILLQISIGDEPPVVKLIQMKDPFNYCGNGASYVHFQVEGDPPAAIIGDPEYVDLCQ